MNDTATLEPDVDPGAGAGGVVVALGSMPPGTILTEEALAGIFGRCPTTIKRAVERRELPPPVRLFGKPCWTAGAILAHLEGRLEDAKREAEREVEDGCACGRFRCDDAAVISEDGPEREEAGR